MRVLIVFGTRPEAIKMAPIIHALQQKPSIETITCVTAQHRQMLDQVLEWFQIKPDYDLNLMQPNQNLAELSASALRALSAVLENTRPDIVLVQGDTTTALIGAMAAFYHRIPVGHVEAGLRTDDVYNPFPEEVNRRLISVIASYHFAPTVKAQQVLLKEGLNPSSVFLTGNPVIDALKWTVAQPYHLDLSLPLDNPDERIILVTAHRRESFGTEFENICNALRQIAERNPNVRLIYPVHLNPHVQEPVYRILKDVDRVHLIQPLPYPALVHLMARAFIVITDSGGIQEEAPALGKPVLVMRQTTERQESIEAGSAKLVGTDTLSIVDAAQSLLDEPDIYQMMANAVSPFGDGAAAYKIVDVLIRFFHS